MADSFQPRFFDLVRNYTTTVGSGNLLLGSAAPGFTGIADVLQPGDCFYYSVIGVDKPSETEAGRGTLQTDGTVARDPVGGKATNFSSGTKTVALVAGAEWFGELDGLRAGGGLSDGDKGDISIAGGVWSIDADAPNVASKAQHVADRAALAAAPTSVPVAFLRESGREGLFAWDAGDCAALVGLDPLQAVYVAAVSDASGASGAWVRKTRTITPFHFGAKGDGASDDLAALQAASDWFFNDGTSFHDYALDLTGDFAIDGELFVGPTTAPPINGRRYNVVGDLRLTQLNPAEFETCRVRNLKDAVVHGRITVQGSGGIDFASRTNGIGITFDNCSVSVFTGGARAFNFWLFGTWFPSTATSFNDQLATSTIRSYDCGSGHSAGTLTANWSSPAQIGSSGSPTQRQTIVVDALPDSVVDTLAGGTLVQCRVRIAGFPYHVYGIDRGTNTVTIYPWLDSAAGGSGTLDWCFGGAVGTQGSDSGIIQFGDIAAIRCGNGLSVASLYGPRVNSMNATACGTGIAIGSKPEGACIGWSIDGYYTEGNEEDVVYHARFGTNFYGSMNSAYALDLSKVWAIGDPRFASGSFGLGGGAIGSTTSGPGGCVSADGVLHRWMAQNLSNPVMATLKYIGQSQPPFICTQVRNSQTVDLQVFGAGEYNRLFGYRGGTLRYLGTGVNGAPIGAFTFVPPAGGTVNGGTVGASLSFSGFDGPADFELCHTDTAQLTWQVRCVGGQSRTNIAALGYASGAGGTVTQATSRATAVTLNKLSGSITLFPASAAAGEVVQFTLSNSQLGGSDTIEMTQLSGAGFYIVTAINAGSGTAVVNVYTPNEVAAAEAPAFQFNIVKGAQS